MKTIVYLYQPYQSIQINQHICCEFSGFIFRVFFKGACIYLEEALFGDKYIITASSKKHTPEIEKIVSPESRGKRIANALADSISSIPHLEYVNSKAEFYQKFAENNDKPNVMYSMIEVRNDAFLLMIADNLIRSKKRYHHKLKCPLTIWIADNISDDEISELYAVFSKYRSISCPLEYLKLPF